MLKGLRALDLTDEKGFLCGKILAELGVDVIKVERPGGDPARMIGPFWHDQADPEKSLYWFAYNGSKRGITLNLKTEDGKQLFRDLVRTADFLIESMPPGDMDRLGFGYPELKRIRKDIILTSITPFGQTGPYSRYQASDLVVMGMAGELFMTGDSDRRQVNISLPQACLHAGADAAVGTMIAHHHRRKTGEGQHVDVSMQQSAAWFLAQTVPHWEMEHLILGRVGTFRTSSRGPLQRQVWECRDGYVFFNIIGGRGGAKTLRELVSWMESEGMPCTKEVAMAKAYINEKYKWVTEKGVLLHGAIGTSREHDMPLYFRRAKAADIRYGGTDFHREIVANKIGLVS
ncbi:MAG: CoA transferase [candidate division WOR-3 bacterium]